MEEQKDNIPVFKSWTAWYLLVVLVLAGLVLFFAWFTKYFS